MALSKPLSYGNWSILMEHLDVNVRHALAVCAPRLRNIDESLPLKIHRLRLDASCFVLNDTEHTFYSYMGSPSGSELPMEIQMMNMMGGQPFDLDQFGNKEPDGDIQPGDINIGHDIGSPARDPPTKTPRWDIVPFVRYYRRPYPSNGPHYLKQSIRFDAGLKIRDLIRKLIETILMKPQTVTLKVLEVDTENCVLRLPEGFKIRIQELRLGDKATHAVEPLEDRDINIDGFDLGVLSPRRSIYDVLDQTSFPLDNFSFVSYGDLGNVWNHEKLMSSKTLKIKYPGGPNIVPLLTPLKNKTIEILNFCISVTRFRVLAISWINNPREIGTKLSMVSPTMFIQRVMDNLCTKSGKKARAMKGNLNSRVCPPEFPHCYTFDVNDASELNFYVQKSKNYEEEIGKRDGLPWIIVMEAMAAGSAVPVDG